MESKIVRLPQSDYKLIWIDPSQPIQIECREKGSRDIITISRQDAMSIVQWAYPDVVYFGAGLPDEKHDAFPELHLKEFHRKIDNAGYEYYEVRYSEEHDEYFLMGVQGSARYPFAQWRRQEDVRSLREIVDDAAPLMHQCIARHGRVGRLSIFLGIVALALVAVDQKIGGFAANKLLLYYASSVFFVAAGLAFAWFLVTYRKYLGATAIIMVENIEDDPVGAIFM